MKLIAYRLPRTPEVALRPSPGTRGWMDDSRARFAYRCLPLDIANAHGWELLCPCAFEALWNGGRGRDAISIVPCDPDVPRERLPASHFGEGVVTFHTGFLFRTEPGYDLYVCGPPNAPKDGIQPLSAVVETDWLPFTFTMNWRLTRPGAVVRFEAGEPFCHFFPVARDLVEQVEPEIRDLEDDREVAERYALWQRSRAQFLLEHERAGTEASMAEWQRHYMRATHPDGERWPGPHRTRVRLREFADARARAPSVPASSVPASSGGMASGATGAGE